jgi:hypothetical protein
VNQQILVVSSLNSIAPANYLIDAFLNLGIEVVAISDVANKRANHVANGAFDVQNYVALNDLQPDLLLFVEGGEMGIFPINFATLRCPKYWWGIDTHNDYLKHLRISRLFDHTFLAQKSFVDSLMKDGIRSVSWLPLAYGGPKPESKGRNIDVAYAGSTDWNLYPERKEYLSAIEDSFQDISIGNCNPKDLFNLYMNSKIVFNFSPMNDLNMRFFEAIGAGALLITNQVIDNGVEDILTEGKEFIEYIGLEDMVEKITHLLSHQDDLRQISGAGMANVSQNHTYVNRVESILALQRPKVFTFANNLDASAALMSLGLVSGSLQEFMRALSQSSRGKRSFAVFAILRIFLKPAIVFARLIEYIAIRIRKRTW